MGETLLGGTKALRELPDALAGSEGLDTVVQAVGDVVTRYVEPGGDLNTVLAGTWLGHPLHPLLTDVTIGAWTGAVVVDLLGGRRGQKAADKLVLLGVLSVAPTVVTGLTDWSTIDSRSQRVGVVHAAGNGVANVLFGLSYIARKRGRRMRGRALALLGLGVAAGAGYLGGDLSYRRGAGVDRTAFDEVARDWTVVADESSVEEGRPTLVDVDGVPVRLVRDGGEVRAVAARCAHQGGPLNEGEIADGCVKCPWHSSRFRLVDGQPTSGPTAHPQPTLQVRVQGGKVEVRR